MNQKQTTPQSNGKSAPKKPRAALGAKCTAAALSKWLRQLDASQFEALDREDDAWYERLETEKKGVIKAAIKNGLKLISIQVADGSALYYEAKRTKIQITFEWLNAGGDLYISDFGKVVSVPLATGQKLIKQFNPNNL